KPGDYWPRIGHGFYNSSATKGSRLSSLSHRVLQYIFAHSTTGRTDSEGVVNARDVLQLWSMCTRTHINIGLFAISCLQRQSKAGTRGVFVGAWITRILKNLDLFPIRELSDCIGQTARSSAAPIIGWGFQP